MYVYISYMSNDIFINIYNDFKNIYLLKFFRVFHKRNF